MAGEAAVLENQTLASFVSYLWRELHNNRVKAMSSWQEVEAYLYATDTNSLQNKQNGHEHTTHIPVVMEIKQDLEAIVMTTLMPHEDWFEFKPANRDEASIGRKKSVESYIKNIHRRNGFRNIVKTLSSDLVTYGNCFVQVKFENNTSGRNVGYVGPKPYRISPYDIVFNPTASDFDSSYKIVREILSLGDFLKMAQSELTDWNQESVQRILDARGSNRDFDKNLKDQQYVPAGYNTWQSYLKSGVVEILTYYGDIYDADNQKLLPNRKIVVADNVAELENSEINTPTGLPYLYHAVWEKRPDNLWGMGALDNILGLNYQINHRENGKSDGLDRLLTPDMVFVGDVEEVYNEERGNKEYYAPEGGNVQELSSDTQFLNFDFHIDKLMAQARRSARLPGELTGFRSAGEKTAFEVGRLTDGAMRGHIHKAQDMEVNLLEPLLQAEVELARDNLLGAIEVTGQTPNGTLEFIEVTPEDLNISGSLKPVGAKRFARKNQILASLSQLSSTPIFQLAAPHISAKGAAKLLEELTELESTELFKENSQIFEQVEQQSLAQSAERMVADEAAQPTLQEDLLDAELEQLQNQQPQ